VNSSGVRVGTDATMVYDAVHNVIAEALVNSIPPSRSRTSRRRTHLVWGEPINAARDRSAQHAAVLVERRVVVFVTRSH